MGEYHDKDEPAQHIPLVKDMVDNDGKLVCQQPANDIIIMLKYFSTMEIMYRL